MKIHMKVKRAAPGTIHTVLYPSQSTRFRFIKVSEVMINGGWYELESPAMVGPHDTLEVEL